MGHDRIPAGPRRATNVPLPTEMVQEAREPGVNVSRACEAGLAVAVKKAREAKWVEENWEAIQSCNRWVEEHGLSLAKYRLFNWRVSMPRDSGVICWIVRPMCSAT